MKIFLTTLLIFGLMNPVWGLDLEDDTFNLGEFRVQAEDLSSKNYQDTKLQEDYTELNWSETDRPTIGLGPVEYPQEQKIGYVENHHSGITLVGGQQRYLMLDFDHIYESEWGPVDFGVDLLRTDYLDADSAEVQLSTLWENNYFGFSYIRENAVLPGVNSIQSMNLTGKNFDLNWETSPQHIGIDDNWKFFGRFNNSSRDDLNSGLKARFFHFTFGSEYDLTTKFSFPAWVGLKFDAERFSGVNYSTADQNIRATEFYYGQEMILGDNYRLAGLVSATEFDGKGDIGGYLDIFTRRDQQRWGIKLEKSVVPLYRKALYLPDNLYLADDFLFNYTGTEKTVTKQLVLNWEEKSEDLRYSLEVAAGKLYGSYYHSEVAVGTFPDSRMSYLISPREDFNSIKLELDYQINDHWEVSGYYKYFNSDEMLYLPKSSFRAALAYFWPDYQLKLAADFRYNSARVTSTNSISPQLESFNLMDLKLSRQFDGSYWLQNIFLEVENLADTDYFIRPGYQGPDRQFNLGVKFEF